jgi:hypothetical protein
MRKCADSSYCGCRKALSYENYNQDDIDSYCSLTDDNGGKANNGKGFLSNVYLSKALSGCVYEQRLRCCRSNCLWFWS